MQKKKTANSAILISVILWLLIGLSFNSNAENISLSDEGLRKIGLDKVRLESGIGVIVFNLSKSHDRLEANGYLTVSNTFNSSVTILCQVVTRLSSVDLDEEKMPRIHKVISNYIIFKPIPDTHTSWISLEDSKAVVNPCSVYNFRYTVNIPLDKEFTPDTSEGYLLYINVRKDMKDATGANVGIDYNYKLFFIFTGELKQGIGFSQWIPLLIPVATIGIFTIFHKVTGEQKPRSLNFDRKDSKKKEVESVHVYIEEPHRDKVTTENDMRQKIDDVLGRREDE